MSPLHIRRLAQARRQSLGFAPDALVSADDLLAALASATGVSRAALPHGDPLLNGALAVFDRESGVIWQDESLPDDARRAHAAHEYAHELLHSPGGSCAPEDFSQSLSQTDAIARVDGYSPRQKQEAEANVCAAELLFPLPLARRLFDENRPASEIAARLGLPLSLVLTQLSDAVLLPPGEEQSEKTERKTDAPLDKSQRAAAEIAAGPLLLGAGPGTGKTKTLVGRCQFLTQTQGISPAQILALTFSNKAAAEMRERLESAGVGGAWVGTFHSFGLEILRRYGEKLDLTPEVKLLDTLDAATLLENNLARLDLKLLDNLYNPAQHLRGILGAISRAKDELCGLEEYKKLCAVMTTDAEEAARELAARTGKILKKDSDAVEKKQADAAKAVEVARSYSVYEQLKTEHGFLDYGDLIFQAVRLLETFPDVLTALQTQYSQVLADEYQDVNRGCARLVRLLAGETASGLWAVGDHRQSIYRFRGASPANVAAFGRDYPGGIRQELAVNYRSRQAIVQTFGASVGASWDAFRGDGEAKSPAVTFAVADDDDAQWNGIARALRENGHAWRAQTILCRTHGQAETLAAELTQRGVPVLYLGDVLERPEVKDLLCFLTLASGMGDSALLRVAAFPEYGASPDESLSVLQTVRETKISLLDALAASPHSGLRRLAAHLSALSEPMMTPDALLKSFLFEHSAFLFEHSAFLRGIETLPKLAISELLNLAADFDRRLVAPGGDGDLRPVRAFLRHVQRRAALGETLRPAVSEAAESLDAVRILTVHAAKGLEFPVVCIPNLADKRFPARGRSSGIPTPPGLADEFGADEMAEDECLFFVALSRAREHLIVSRPEKSGDKLLPPSPLLASLNGLTETRWTREETSKSEESESDGELTGEKPTFSVSALETYQRCPRQYFYQHEWNLPGVFLAAGYPQFHGCMRQVLEWLSDERELEKSPTEHQILMRLDAVWTQSGPVGHLHEAKYRQMAETMLRTAQAEEHQAWERLPQTTLTATLETCRVRMRPDALARDPLTDTLQVTRHQTRKASKDDANHPRLSVLRRAASETHPALTVQLELRYLEDGARVSVTAPESDYQKKLDAARVEKYEAAGRGIRLHQFAPAPGDECGACPYRLICPA